MATIKTNVITPVATGYIEISREYNNGDGTGRFITYTIKSYSVQANPEGSRY